MRSTLAIEDLRPDFVRLSHYYASKPAANVLIEFNYLKGAHLLFERRDGIPAALPVFAKRRSKADSAVCPGPCLWQRKHLFFRAGHDLGQASLPPLLGGLFNSGGDGPDVAGGIHDPADAV